MRDLPPLPAALTRMRTVIGIGTVLWLVAAVVALGDGAAAAVDHLPRGGRARRRRLGGVRLAAGGRPAGLPYRPERPRALTRQLSAESFFHCSHDSVQSQMSPSRAASGTGVPVTSTGSPYCAMS